MESEASSFRRKSDAAECGFVDQVEHLITDCVWSAASSTRRTTPVPADRLQPPQHDDQHTS